jgi:hypothetical protein
MSFNPNTSRHNSNTSIDSVWFSHLTDEPLAVDKSDLSEEGDVVGHGSKREFLYNLSI